MSSSSFTSRADLWWISKYIQDIKPSGGLIGSEEEKALCADSIDCSGISIPKPKNRPGFTEPPNLEDPTNSTNTALMIHSSEKAKEEPNRGRESVVTNGNYCYVSHYFEQQWVKLIVSHHHHHHHHHHHQRKPHELTQPKAPSL